MNETKKTFVGTVTSDKMHKTIVVRVTRRRWHAKYLRQYSLHSTFKVHDEKNACKVGDTVEFVETRPLSKEKRWRVVKNLSRT